VLARAKAAGAKRLPGEGLREAFRFGQLPGAPNRQLVSEAGHPGLALEVFVDGHYAGAGDPGFRTVSLEGFVSDTVDRAKITEIDPFRSLPDLDRQPGYAPIWTLNLAGSRARPGFFGIGTAWPRERILRRPRLDRCGWTT